MATQKPTAKKTAAKKSKPPLKAKAPKAKPTTPAPRPKNPHATTWNVSVGATARLYAHFTVEAESYDEAWDRAEEWMRSGLRDADFSDIRSIQMDREPEIS